MTRHLLFLSAALAFTVLGCAPAVQEDVKLTPEASAVEFAMGASLVIVDETNPDKDFVRDRRIVHLKGRAFKVKD